MISLRLETDPPQVFYEPILCEVGALHRPLGGENANVTVSLDNVRGTLTADFLDPPLLVAARLFRDEDVLLSGCLSRVEMGATLRLEIEA